MAIQIAIHGAAGRMGRRLIDLCREEEGLVVHAAIEHLGHPRLGDDCGEVSGCGKLGVPITDRLPETAQVVIDFSVPQASLSMAEQCAIWKIPIVIATTGFDELQIARIRNLAKEIAIVRAASMSLMVNLATRLTAIAAEALHSQGVDVDVEIVERHHRFKEDAPSGTALQFGRTIAEIMGQHEQVHGREGRLGPRSRHEIGYHAIRAGDNPGEHTIVFGALGETLEVTVRASNRDCYAQGALAAAKFVVSQPPGEYNMLDVLGKSSDVD